MPWKFESKLTFGTNGPTYCRRQCCARCGLRSTCRHGFRAGCGGLLQGQDHHLAGGRSNGRRARYLCALDNAALFEAHPGQSERHRVESCQAPAAPSLRAIFTTTAPKDGTSMGLVFPSVLIDPLYSEAVRPFDANRFRYVGNANAETPICFVHRDVPIKKLDDILHADIVLGGTTPGSAVVDFPNVSKSLLGAKWRLIPGYKATREMFYTPSKVARCRVCGIGRATIRWRCRQASLERVSGRFWCRKTTPATPSSTKGAFP